MTKAPTIRVIPAGDQPVWRSKGWSPCLDAASAAEAVADAVLAHIRDSILLGKHPATGAPVRPLNPRGAQGRRAMRGLRPNIRGNTGSPRGLPRKLRRVRVQRLRAVKESAVVARTQIVPPGKLADYVTREAAAGTEFLSGDGAVLRAAETALEQWLAAALAGDAAAADGADLSADQKKS